MQNAIIFDLGGVLIDWNPRYLFRKLFDDTSEMEYFLEHVCTSDWNEMQDAGRPIAEAVEERSKRWPEYEDLIRAYYDRWTEMVGGKIPETVQILAELHQKQVPLYALTNWSAETYPYVDRYEFMNWFRGVVVSGKEGLIKPDPRIFRLILSRYDLDPQATVFIDDNFRNIVGAREAGLITLHFTSSQRLADDLKSLGFF